MLFLPKTENYATYKELCDYDVFAVIKQLSETNDTHAAAQIARRLQHRQMPTLISLDNVDIQAADALLAEFKHQHQHDIQDWQLAIIKTPHQAYSLDEDPILVTNENGGAKPINELSLMINAISDKYENTSFLYIDSALTKHEPVTRLTKTLLATTTLPERVL